MSDSISLAHDGDFPDRGPAVFAVTAATLVLATVFVAARMVCRAFIVRNFTWDDRVMMLAWLITFFLSFTICYGVRNGLGRHDTDIPDEHWPILRRCEYVFSILYNPALMATKTSILIFYLRLASNTQRVLRFASWLTLAIVNIAGIILTFMNIFQCKPTDAAWNSDFNEQTSCIPLLTEFICSSPVNIVTDLAILALPIPVLTGMRLPSRQKTILVLTFTIGIFVTIVDVIRIYYLQQAITEVPTGSSSDPSSRFGGQADFAWNASLSLLWSAVEVNVGMTCACVPTLKPLVLKLLPAMLYDPDGTRSDRSKGPNDSDTPSTGNHGNVATPPPVAFPGSQKPLSDSNAPMSAMEFLTTPFGPSDRALQANGNTTQTGTTLTSTTLTSSTSTENGVYFGFVNMARPKSMLKSNASESLKYCTIVSILFLLWGVSYGLLNTLNNVVAAVNHMSTAQTLGMTSAYFGGGYFFGPLLVGEWILRRDEHNRSRRHRRGNSSENTGGFKVTFIVGLCIYGVGTIIFWPSAVTNSYGGFMLSNFVVGFGLSVLEVGANAFLILCGPPEYGETRLLLAQGVQGVGSLLSGLLAQKVFFKDIAQDTMSKSNSMTLINVQWTYLGITLLCVILGLFFYYMPLPEVNDDELEESAKHLSIDPQKRSFGGLQLRTWALILAVVAQYSYVAAQECNSIYFRSLMISILPNQENTGTDAASGSNESPNPDKPPGISLSIQDYLLIGHTAFAVSRFMAAGFTYLSVSHPRLPKPRAVLTTCIALCFLFALLPVVIRPPNPNLLVIPIILFFFFEGPIWPLIFAIGLRGQGRRTKRAAAFITMGASGPAFFPFVMYAIIARGGTVKTAFVVIIALQAVTMAYPIFLEFVKDAKKLSDPCPAVRGAPRGDVNISPMENVLADRQRHKSMNEKAGFFDKMSKGIGAKLLGSQRRSSQPTAQHEENIRNQPLQP